MKIALRLIKIINPVAALLLIYLLTVALLLAPAGVVRGTDSRANGFAGSRYDMDRYWQTLRLHLEQLAAGNLLMAPPGGPPAETDAMLLPVEAQTTLAILAGGITLSLLLGAITGYLLSRYSPSRLRRPVWAVTSLVLSMPDLLLIVLLQMLLLYGGLMVGLRIHVYGAIIGENTWRRFVTPIIGMGLIGIPYTARIVSAALEEVATQRYVQAARARGLKPWTVLWRYVGRNGLVRAWGALPTMLGVVVSAEPIVEYMTDMPGLGRHLTRHPIGYDAALTLLPVLISVTVLYAMIDAAGNRVNPAPAHEPDESPQISGRSDLRVVRVALRDLADFAAELARGCRSWPRRLYRALRTNGLLLAGLLLVAGMIIVGVFAPHLARYSWEQQEPIRVSGDFVMVPPFPPNERNWLGSDGFGRDILSHLIWGTRFALLFALLAVPLRFAVALALGMAAAYRGGWLGYAVQRTATMFASLPAVLLPLALIPGLNDIYVGRPWPAAVAGILVIALPGVPRLAEAIRLTFGEILGRPFIEGARAAGAGGTRILLRHVLPHAMPAIATMAALEVPVVMTITAFLGLRHAYVGGTTWDPQTLQPLGPLMPEWGSMITPPFELLFGSRWWLWLPLVSLFVGVLAFTLLGEGLRRQALGNSSADHRY